MMVAFAAIQSARQGRTLVVRAHNQTDRIDNRRIGTADRSSPNKNLPSQARRFGWRQLQYRMLT